MYTKDFKPVVIEERSYLGRNTPEIKIFRYALQGKPSCPAERGIPLCARLPCLIFNDAGEMICVVGWIEEMS